MSNTKLKSPASLYITSNSSFKINILYDLKLSLKDKINCLVIWKYMKLMHLIWLPIFSTLFFIEDNVLEFKS